MVVPPYSAGELEELMRRLDAEPMDSLSLPIYSVVKYTNFHPESFKERVLFKLQNRTQSAVRYFVLSFKDIPLHLGNACIGGRLVMKWRLEIGK